MNVIFAEKLSLRTAQYDDINELNKIYEQVVDYFKFDPSHIFVTPEKCLTDGDLPPGGTRENYEIYAICDNHNVIGYVDFYKGFPDENIAYISLLYLDKNKRKYGYGSEVVTAVCSYLKGKKITEIRLAVSLKNWSALKFWYKCGFDTISQIAGDADFSLEGYACIELKKALIMLN